MSSKHSRTLPLSGGDRWVRCPGSVALIGPDTFGGSAAAAEGTVAHWVAEQALRSGAACAEWIGTERTELSDDGTEHWDFVVDAEMCAYAQVYVDYCRRLANERPGATLIEHHVDLADVLGANHPGGHLDFAQADSLITGILETVDLKYGFTRVEAEDNYQQMLYALGVMLDAEKDGNTFEEIRMTIAQPRLDWMPTATITTAELANFGLTAQAAAEDGKESLGMTAEQLHERAFLHPGEKQCEWCPAKARCPALAAYVNETVFNQDGDAWDNPQVIVQPVPVDTDALAAARDRVDLVQSWCKAIVAEVDSLTHKHEMPGWKLVSGKKGNRAWSDADAAEKMLKSFRMKNEDMYSQTVITPTVAQKVLTPKRWEKASALVTQPDGKATAVPASDPRTEIPTAALFDEPDPTEGLI